MRELFAEMGIREVQPMLRLDAERCRSDAEPWLVRLITALRGWVGAPLLTALV